MNDEIQAGRGSGIKSETSGRFSNSGGRGQGHMGWVVALLVVVVVVVLGFVFRDNIFGGSVDDSSKDKTETGGVGMYQAVFLSNGQVYFGKLGEVASDYAELSDIYYLQVTNPPLQGSAEQGTQQQPQLQLVKLGNELHGPEDKMHINREHILFFEDLKDEGRVVKAIREYQANPNRGAQTQQPAQQQAPATQTTPATQQQTVPAGN